VPILPGKKDDVIAFANSLSGPRLADFNNAQTTVTKECWFLQETPMGDFLIVYFHAPDPEAVHAGLAASTEPFDVWFRSQVLEFTGIDLTTPPPSLPRQLLNWAKP